MWAKLSCIWYPFIGWTPMLAVFVFSFSSPFFFSSLSLWCAGFRAARSFSLCVFIEFLSNKFNLDLVQASDWSELQIKEMVANQSLNDAQAAAEKLFSTCQCTTHANFNNVKEGVSQIPQNG